MKKNLRWLERLLLLIAIICLGSYAYAFFDTRLYEYQQSRRLEQALQEQAKHPPAVETDSFESFKAAAKKEKEKKDEDPSGGGNRVEKEEKTDEGEIPEQPLPDLPDGDLIGRIEIPRVGVSALVLEGVGHRTLRRGVGHIPETALPAQDGNVGIAGHRDSFFRGLKTIGQDDVIKLTTLRGIYRYRVEWTRIVNPQDTEVLADTGEPALTLVTCYPFYYVGSAPKRFIVRAQLIEEEGDS
ncbi:MAG TPA: class D sortase [Thermoanaerobaculia bacterium]